MDQNSAQKKLQSLLTTREGMQLMKLLSADGGSALRQAGEALKAGDQQKVRDIMSPMLNNSQVQNLLSSLEKEMQDG